MAMNCAPVGGSGAVGRCHTWFQAVSRSGEHGDAARGVGREGERVGDRGVDAATRASAPWPAARRPARSARRSWCRVRRSQPSARSSRSGVPAFTSSISVVAICARTSPFFEQGAYGVSLGHRPVHLSVHVDVVEEDELRLRALAGLDRVVHDPRPEFLPDAKVVLEARRPGGRRSTRRRPGWSVRDRPDRRRAPPRRPRAGDCGRPAGRDASWPPGSWRVHCRSGHRRRGS